jgi:hypothetical protein
MKILLGQGMLGGIGGGGGGGDFLPLAGGTMDAGADINFANASRLREGLTDAGNGGAGGVALVCSLDYEFKWEAGRLYVMGQDGFTIRVEQYGFTAVPTASDDVTKGYVQGSRRILDDGSVYVCTDATEDAAVWDQIVDWPNSTLYGANNTPSVNWSGRTLLNPSGSTAVNWGTGALLASNGSPAVDWEQRLLFDSLSGVSAHWQQRQLYSDDGVSPVMDWTDIPYFPIGLQSNGVLGMNNNSIENAYAVSAYGFYSTEIGTTTLVATNGEFTNLGLSGIVNLVAQSGTGIYFELGSVIQLEVGSTLNLNGTVSEGNSTLSGAGAVPLTHPVCRLTSTGAAQAITLANGTAGQKLTIFHGTDGGSMVLTATTKVGWATSITFTNVGDNVVLQFFNSSGWAILSSRGVTIV